MRGDGDVAGDEQRRRALLAHQPLQQIEHLRLNSDVETARCVVGNHQLGRANQCHSDRHPLRHAAAEFMRESLEATLRIGNTHRAQDVERKAIALSDGRTRK